MSKSLHEAVYTEDLDRVKTLLAEGVDLNVADLRHKMTPLQSAAKQGHDEIAIMLLDAGANPNLSGPGVSIHHHPVRRGSELVVDLLSDGATSALHYAATHGSLKLVTALLAAGAKTEVRDCLGFTPLHDAAKKGHENIVNALLEVGAVVDSVNNKRGSGGSCQTPLHMAVVARKEAVVVTLLKAGADPNFKDGDGYTPLHYAAKLGFSGIARTLLEFDASVNEIKRYFNTTPLSETDRGSPFVVEHLLQFGAGIGARVPAKQAKTVMFVALSHNLPIIGVTFERRQEIIVTETTEELWALMEQPGLITTTEAFRERHEKTPYTSEELNRFLKATNGSLEPEYIATQKIDETRVAELQSFQQYLTECLAPSVVDSDAAAGSALVERSRNGQAAVAGSSGPSSDAGVPEDGVEEKPSVAP